MTEIAENSKKNNESDIKVKKSQKSKTNSAHFPTSDTPLVR